jgi:hypothetical protein
MKILTPDYQMDSKQLRFWLKVHAEMLHEGTHQIFRTWILQDWKTKWDVKTLHLKTRYNPQEYVENFIREVENEEAKIK